MARLILSSAGGDAALSAAGLCGFTLPVARQALPVLLGSQAVSHAG